MADRNPFQWISSPNPSVWGFSYTISGDQFLDPTDFPTEGETTFNDLKHKYAGRSIDKPLGDYVYTQPAPAPAGFVGFYFGPTSTTSQATPFRSTADFGNHPWPDILESLDWYPDVAFPIAGPSTDGTNLGMTFGRRSYERRVYIPGTNEGTKFVTQEFFDAVQFNIPQHPTPLPTEIQWEFLGQKGSIPSCLHGDIDIKGKIAAVNAYYSTGVTNVSSIASNQFFPATNYEDWAPYIIHDQQKQVEVGWHRTQVTVYPPAKPESIKSR